MNGTAPQVQPDPALSSASVSSTSATLARGASTVDGLAAAAQSTATSAAPTTTMSEPLPGSLFFPPKPKAANLPIITDPSVDPPTPAPVLVFGLWNPSDVERLRGSGVVFGLAVGVWLMTKLGGGFTGALLLGVFFGHYYSMSQDKLARKLRLEAEFNASKKKAQLGAEEADWFNAILAKFWLAYEPTLSATIKGSLEPILEWVCPTFIDSMKFSQFTLGTFPPQLRTIISSRYVSDDVIDFQFDLSLGSFGPRVSTTLTSGSTNDEYLAASSSADAANAPGSATLSRGGSAGNTGGGGAAAAATATSSATSLDDPDTATGAAPPGTADLALSAASMANSRVDLVVRIKGIALTVRAENVTLEGRMRVRMKLMSAFPFVKILEVFFLEPPKIGFELRPLVVGRHDCELDCGVSVYPNPLVLPFDDWFNNPMLETDASIGVLVVHIKNAVGLRNADILGKSDPYVQVTLANQAVAKTAVINNNLNPFWGKYVIVSKLEDTSLKLEVYDYDKSLRNKLLGYTEFNLGEIDPAGGAFRQTEFDLVDNEKRPGGKLRASVSFYPVATPAPAVAAAKDATKDSAAAPAASSDTASAASPPAPAAAQLAGTTTAAECPSGILKVTCHAARSLESTSKLRNPYVQVAFNGENVYTTRTKKHSNTPLWEETFEVFVPDFKTAKLHFRVRDDSSNVVGKSDQLLGQTVVNVSQGIKKKQQDDWWSLTDATTRDAKLRMTMKWRPVPLRNESAHHTAGALRVRVVGCFDLKGSLGSAKINPYVRLLTAGKPVSLQVWDYSRVSKDNFVGSVTLDLSKYLKANEETGYLESIGSGFEMLELMHQSHSKPRGKISVEVSFHPKNPAMNFSPDAHEVCGVMKLNVHQLKDLPRKANTFFEIYTEDPGLCLFRSPTRKRSSDPIFEQAVEVFIRQVYWSPLHIVIREDLGSSTSGPGEASGQALTAAAKSLTASAAGLVAHDSGSGAGKHGKGQPIIASLDMYAYDVIKEGLGDERWYAIGSGGAAASKAKLSFDFTPVDCVIDKNESFGAMGMLHLEIVGARNLPKVDQLGTCDPYCTVLLDGDKWHKTSVKQKNLNPVWKERTKIPIANRNRSVLKFQVWDWDRVGNNDLVDEAELNLAELVMEKQHTEELPLSECDNAFVIISYRFEPQRMDKIPSRHLTMTKATLDKFNPRPPQLAVQQLVPQLDGCWITLLHWRAIVFGRWRIDRHGYDGETATIDGDVTTLGGMGSRENSTDGLPRASSADFGSNSSLNTYVEDHPDKVTERGALTVTVIEATNLIAPQVCHQASPERPQPTYYESFTAPLPRGALTHDLFVTKCSVIDSNRVQTDTLIGTFEFNLWDLVMERIQSKKAVMDPRGTGWMHVSNDMTMTLNLDANAIALANKMQMARQAAANNAPPRADTSSEVYIGSKARAPPQLRVHFAVLIPPGAFNVAAHPMRPLPPGIVSNVDDHEEWKDEVLFPTALASSPPTPLTATYAGQGHSSQSLTANERDALLLSPTHRSREGSSTFGVGGMSDASSIMSHKSHKSGFSKFKKVFGRSPKDKEKNRGLGQSGPSKSVSLEDIPRLSTSSSLASN
ncbi:hypothetical protein BCR44DRAFT_1496796 [Catenaria anguillulae PL171]|uniref:C2 domain-containing protein n=1 Tax=Catenaria anguillulae PL171 TaxID=765915 RepID=A0A1Y2I1K1_9FUNG|nr:hypothetical protein BCR44DRAFT_1496796 [Catenaria anguillulae PL171]